MRNEGAAIGASLAPYSLKRNNKVHKNPKYFGKKTPKYFGKKTPKYFGKNTRSQNLTE